MELIHALNVRLARRSAAHGESTECVKASIQSQSLSSTAIKVKCGKMTIETNTMCE